MSVIRVLDAYRLRVGGYRVIYDFDRGELAQLRIQFFRGEHGMREFLADQRAKPLTHSSHGHLGCALGHLELGGGGGARGRRFVAGKEALQAVEE